MGPTASGKTALAVELVKKLPLEIISVDSALVYRDMAVGTARPEPDILQAAPHRLIDFLDPSQSYSAAQFRADALREMADITAHGRIPLLVGGTMLYFKALEQGLDALPSADPALRAELEAEAGERGWPALHAELMQLDPVTAQRLHPNDAQRIQRALEVQRSTGKPLSQLQGAGNPEAGSEAAPYRLIKLAIAPRERSELHRRIAQRLETMLAKGFVEEVRALYARGDLSLAHPAIRAVGYRQLWQYLQGVYTLEEANYRALTATRQFAKRQLTWLRAWPDLVWFETPVADGGRQVAENTGLTAQVAEHLRSRLSKRVC